MYRSVRSTENADSPQVDLAVMRIDESWAVRRLQRAKAREENVAQRRHRPMHIHDVEFSESRLQGLPLTREGGDPDFTEDHASHLIRREDFYTMAAIPEALLELIDAAGHPGRNG
jgi:hypothetical protein